MIIDTITNEYALWEWQQQSGNYKNALSLEGAKALFHYFDDLSDELGEPMEFDPIAWLCDFSEYDNLKDFNLEYSGGKNSKEFTLDSLQDHAPVIELDNGHLLIGEF